MNTLNLSVAGAGLLRFNVLIDGNELKGKRSRYCSDFTYTTEASSATVELVTYNELDGRFWFLWSLFYFIISLFGILDPPYEKRCYSVEYKAVVQLDGETAVKIKLKGFAEGQRAAEAESGAAIEELANVYYVDATARRRRKIIIITRLLAWIGIIALGVWLLIKFVIG